MTDETPIPDDDALASATRRALGRLADDGVTVAPWDEVRARGHRTQRMRAAVAIAAALLIVVAGAATVSAVNGAGDHVNSLGADHGGSTTTTEVPTSTTAAPTTTTTRPPVATPGGGAPPVVIPQFPEAQAGDFEGSIQVASTTLTATQPMSVTLTIRNISDHAIYVAGNRPIGVFLGFYSATGMTGSVALFAPGETRTYTSTINATPALIGTEQLSAAVLTAMPPGLGTNPTILAGVPPVDVTVVPPGWAPGRPLDPSLGHWNISLTTDVSQVVVGDPLVVHVQLTNTGDQPQQTIAYGALGVSCHPYDLGNVNGMSLPAATLAPGDQTTFDLNFDTKDFTPDPNFVCFGGLEFPSYDGSAIGDIAGGTLVLPHAGTVSNPITVPLVAETPTSGP